MAQFKIGTYLINGDLVELPRLTQTEINALTIPDGSLVFNTTTNSVIIKSNGTNQTFTSDHGSLTGLNDDDHTQYLNNTRGDVRYYQKSEVNTLLIPKVETKFIQTTVITHGNNTGENNLLGTYVIPTGDFTLNKVFEVDLNGVLSRGGGSSIFKVFLGTALIGTTTAINLANVTNVGFTVKVNIRVVSLGVAGSVFCGGFVMGGVTNYHMTNANNTLPTTVDTTIGQQLKITHQFSATNNANSFTSFIGTVKHLTL